MNEEKIIKKIGEYVLLSNNAQVNEICIECGEGAEPIIPCDIFINNFSGVLCERCIQKKAPKKLIELRDKEWKKFSEKKPEWIEVKGVYHIDATIEEYKGFKNVNMIIFRWDTKKVPFNAKEYVPKNINEKSKTDDMVLQQIKEQFTLDEIEQIKKYLITFPGTTISEPLTCFLPKNEGVMPTGGIPVGGGQDFYLFYESENYPLGDLKIAGYYDLRRHERTEV